MPVNACRHVRKMRGAAQAHLLEADDGYYYVVKFLNNAQHRRILVNEFIAGAFFRYLQVTVPETAIVAVSQEFLAANPQAYLQMGERRVPVLPGWHFGSRYPGDPNRLAVYDFLPDALMPQVGNLSHFLGALVLDKWMSNADARQSVYFRARIAEWMGGSSGRARKAGFLASMIDHGFVFNGPHWELQDTPLQGLAPRPAVYLSVSSWDDFQPWLDQVVHFPEEVVDHARKQVPSQWLEDDASALDQMLDGLLRRRRRVPDLIDACRRARPNLFPRWK